jgi:hypothetical protein
MFECFYDLGCIKCNKHCEVPEEKIGKDDQIDIKTDTGEIIGSVFFCFGIFYHP